MLVLNLTVGLKIKSEKEDNVYVVLKTRALC